MDGRWKGRAAFVRMPRPRSLPMKPYICRWRGLVLLGFGTYLSMLWIPVMPSTKPSCSALRFAQGRSRCTWGMWSSLTMSERLSRYGPPASMLPSPTNWTRQARSCAWIRSSRGGREFTREKIWPKMVLRSTRSDPDFRSYCAVAQSRFTEISPAPPPLVELCMARLQTSSLAWSQTRAQHLHSAWPRDPGTEAWRKSMSGMAVLSCSFRCLTTRSRTSSTSRDTVLRRG
mmetsp:Transcript_19231/g.55947  ORF Transcript_19231/g.55947 Transcript_19231/m.55947 type:complete len:230 (-) Transcript_19231:430-1119(-)